MLVKKRIRSPIIALSALVILVSTGLLLRELYLIRKRHSRISTHENSVLNLTYLILLTLVIFTCCLIPPGIYFLSTTQYSVIPEVILDSYAVLNVVVNGIIRKGYRAQLIKCLQLITSPFKRNHEVATSPMPLNWKKSFLLLSCMCFNL